MGLSRADWDEAKHPRDRRGQFIGYKIETSVKKGYELPEWHKSHHDTLESAQAEVTKLRQWDAGGGALKKMVIKERFALNPSRGHESFRRHTEIMRREAGIT